MSVKNSALSWLEKGLDQYGDLAYRICLRRTGNAADAADAYQDACLILLRRASEFRQGTALKAWICAWMSRASLKLVRRRKLRNNMPQKLENLVPDEKSPLANAERGEQITHLHMALATLSQTDRLAVELRYYEGLSDRDVAGALGCSEDAASMRIRRGVEKLRKQFGRGVALALLLSLFGDIVRAESEIKLPAELKNWTGKLFLTTPPSLRTISERLTQGALDMIIKPVLFVGIAMFITSVAWVYVEGEKEGKGAKPTIITKNTQRVIRRAPEASRSIQVASSQKNRHAEPDAPQANQASLTGLLLNNLFVSAKKENSERAKRMYLDALKNADTTFNTQQAGGYFTSCATRTFTAGEAAKENVTAIYFTPWGKPPARGYFYYKYPAPDLIAEAEAWGVDDKEELGNLRALGKKALALCDNAVKEVKSHMANRKDAEQLQIATKAFTAYYDAACELERRAKWAIINCSSEYNYVRRELVIGDAAIGDNGLLTGKSGVSIDVEDMPLDWILKFAFSSSYNLDAPTPTAVDEVKVKVARSLAFTRVTVKFKNQTEDNALRIIAKAIGATVIKTTTGWKLVPQKKGE